MHQPSKLETAGSSPAVVKKFFETCSDVSKNSPNRSRTCDLEVNSLTLYRLSYRRTEHFNDASTHSTCPGRDPLAMDPNRRF